MEECAHTFIKSIEVVRGFDKQVDIIPSRHQPSIAILCPFLDAIKLPLK